MNADRVLGRGVMPEPGRLLSSERREKMLAPGVKRILWVKFYKKSPDLHRVQRLTTDNSGVIPIRFFCQNISVCPFSGAKGASKSSAVGMKTD